MDIRYGRKRSGIRRELIEKITDWLSTIEDEGVRKAAERDVIVTGGAIASMLLGEKVHDFDVYFRTRETTRAVTEYYVRQFVARHLAAGTLKYEPEVRDEKIANARGVEEERVTIFIRSAGIAAEDEDTLNYFEGLSESERVEEAEQAFNELAEDPGKPRYRPVFLSQNAITLSNKVQVVIRFYGEPEQIHDNYDFVHATCYWHHRKRELELPAAALEALLSRTLIYRGSLYPIASIFRMKKFLERGWRITAGQQLKIMWQINELDLKQPSVLREQLTGVDMAYMYMLIEALRDTDPEEINASYVGEVIDRIFD